MTGRRKLLQVANVCTLLGGPGALTWTITKALPGWDHAVVFVNSGKGNVPEWMQNEFNGVPVLRDPNAVRPTITGFDPDAILFHNSAPPQIKAADESGSKARRIYYQHSAMGAAKPARAKCDRVITVSHHLAKIAGLPPEAVLYQPVPVPPGRDERGELRVGRICTPNARKWEPADNVPLYESLAADHPAVHWEFIGCPDRLQAALRKACGGRCSFNIATWAARGRLWHWQAMLYQSTLTETYGRTVAEAQRCGCIPIVSDRGGFREQIADQVNGFLCNDSAEFSQAIRDVSDPAALSQLQSEAIRAGDDRGCLWHWRRRFLELVDG